MLNMEKSLWNYFLLVSHQTAFIWEQLGTELLVLRLIVLLVQCHSCVHRDTAHCGLQTLQDQSWECQYLQLIL